MPSSRVRVAARRSGAFGSGVAAIREAKPPGSVDRLVLIW